MAPKDNIQIQEPGFHNQQTYQEKVCLFKKILDEITDYLLILKENGAREIECFPAHITQIKSIIQFSPSEKLPAAPQAKIQPERIRKQDSADIKKELEQIATQISRCTKCALCKSRKKTVPGQGTMYPDIMFVGEAPGHDEDLKGIAFIGRAGQLLTRMIARMGYQRKDVFIGNIIKCRPPANRKPLPQEMEACMPYLRKQIALLQPKVIIGLGASALEGLFNTQVKITRQRGKWMEFEDIPLMPTFHPSYLLRNPAARWDVWDDMLEVLNRLGRKPAPPPDR